MKTALSILLSSCLMSITPPAMAAPDIEAQQILSQWDLDEHHDLRGVIIMRQGQVLAERYYNGETADTLHDIRSAGKSITSLLMGIAIDRGLIAGTSAPVRAYWREAEPTEAGKVKIADLLTMRSGLDAYDADPTSPGQEDKLDDAADPQAFLLGLPQANAPGAVYRYNSATSAIAGVVVAKAAGTTMAEFAGEQLFGPMGIKRWTWASDAGGFTKGQGNLSLTLRDFAAIGEMVRQGGISHGRKIVSESWLRKSLAPIVPIADSDPYAGGYGYYWHSKTQKLGGRAIRVSFASGNGGNKLYIVPDLDMVVAITSSAYGKEYGQKRSEQILLTMLREIAQHMPKSSKFEQ